MTGRLWRPFRGAADNRSLVPGRRRPSVQQGSDFPQPRGGEKRPSEAELLEVCMSLLDRILDRKIEPRKRVRICVECGMPVEEHKEWCAILQGQKELAQRGITVPSASKT